MIQALRGQFSITQVALHFSIQNHGIISRWLRAFDRQGINCLLPKLKGRPIMKLKYPKMLPKPKTEEERLRYRILEFEAEIAILKKLQELNQQEMQKRSVS